MAMATNWIAVMARNAPKLTKVANTYVWKLMTLVVRVQPHPLLKPQPKSHLPKHQPKSHLPKHQPKSHLTEHHPGFVLYSTRSLKDFEDSYPRLLYSISTPTTKKIVMLWEEVTWDSTILNYCLKLCRVLFDTSSALSWLRLGVFIESTGHRSRNL
jgi:hypothetical protein